MFTKLQENKHVRGMNMIISVINQKGGVAKITSTFNIAGNLASEG